MGMYRNLGERYRLKSIYASKKSVEIIVIIISSMIKIGALSYHLQV